MANIPQNLTEKLTEISDALIGDTIGLCQAMDLLRKSFDKMSAHIDARNYEAASTLGYRDIASDFVFLQRVLGGLQSSCNDRDAIIQELAQLNGTSFEEEKTGAHAVMDAMQPNPDKPRTYTDEELYQKGNLPLNEEADYLASMGLLRGKGSLLLGIVAIKCHQGLTKRAEQGDETAQLMLQVVERCKDPVFMEEIQKRRDSYWGERLSRRPSNND